MDEQTTGSRSSLTPSVPWPVWLLVGGAVVQLGVQVAPDSYSVFGPYFLVDAGMVLDWVHAISLFLLAAAVVLAAGRWPAGRRRLLLGAAALAVVAVLRMVSDIWWALWEAYGHTWDVGQPWVPGLYVITGAMFVAAQVLLAAGLWAAAAHRPMGRSRGVLVAVIGIGGLLATAAGLWTVARTLAGEGEHLAYAVAITVLTAASFAALAALAMAAARATPRRGGMPEVLVAVGASVSLAATAWAWSFPYFTPQVQEVSEDAFIWVFTLPYAAGIAGTLTMVAGFALAGLALHRARTADDPGA